MTTDDVATTLSRRSAVTVAAGGLLLPLAGGGATPALAAVPRLSGYTVLLGNRTGSAEDTAGGIRLRGGAFDDFASGVRLFGRARVGASGRVRYRLTREIVPSVTTGRGVFFNVGLVWGRDPASLPRATPTADEAIAPLFRGFRITHANLNSLSPALSDEIRLRVYPSRAEVRRREAREVTDRFARGEPHSLELAWGGGVVTLTDRTARVAQSFASSALRVPSSGAYLMFYASFGGGYLLGDVA